jgi:integrase
VIRYQRDGVRIEEPVGWSREGWTAEKAADELAVLKQAAKKGEGARSLREKREAEEARRQAKARQAERNRKFGDVVDLFLADAEGRLRPKTVQGYRACLLEAKDYRPGRDLPVLHEWPIRDIERRHLAGLINMVARKSSAKAVLMRSSLSAFYSFAVHSPEEFADINPVRDVKRPVSPLPRERFLTDVEIKDLLSALEDEALRGDDAMKRLLQFVLLTGCRLREATEMQRSEIDGRWWEIPSGRFKGKRPHRVYLTESALALLEGEGEMPFASPRTGKAYDPSSVARYLKRVQYFGLQPFGMHDFRRTLASGLAGLGYSMEVIGAVLGHKLPGVTGAHYLKHKYDQEKQQALETWERHVLGLVEGKGGANVIPLMR